MSDCCGDAHAELEWMKMAFDSLGIETRVKEDCGAKEISYYNLRAMRAEVKLIKARELLTHLLTLAECAMVECQKNGEEWDIEEELKEARTWLTAEAEPIED